MKQTFTALLVVLLFATIVVLAAEKAAKKSPVDILIARINGDYAKALEDADAFYKKLTAPYTTARNKKILTAGSKAIRRFNAARKGVSELDGIKMEKEIEKIRISMDDRVGDDPTVIPVMKVCGVSFKGHKYLVIGSNANWKEADALCKKMGGHLVYIETAEEMLFLAKTFPGLRLWVGASDAHKEGDWRWGNGKSVVRDLWFKGEPNNSYGIQHYARLTTNNDKGGLNDAPLNNGGAVGFICEWE